MCLPIIVDERKQHKQATINGMTMTLEPLFVNNTLFYLSQYRVYVLIGAYVMFNSGDAIVVRRILDIIGDQVVVNQFVTKKKLPCPNLIVAAPMADESVRYMI
jgi:hypothetical protein